MNSLLKQMPAVVRVCPEISEWPRRWMVTKEDLRYGDGILSVFIPFIQHLIDAGLSQKVIRNHCTNLWILGGEIVRRVSVDAQRHVDPRQVVADSVDSEGGPLCRHLETPFEIRSFDTTCRRLHAYLTAQERALANQSPRTNADPER